MGAEAAKAAGGSAADAARRLRRRWILASVLPSAGTAARLVSVGWQAGREKACLLCGLPRADSFAGWQQGMDAIALFMGERPVRHGMAFGAGVNAAETTRDE